jgi:1,2-diacylglycerol 3-alpha-glucosyltransferase
MQSDFFETTRNCHNALTKGPQHQAMYRRPPRILMLSDVYFPRVNGVSTSIQTFRTDLAALDCETLLVAPAYDEAYDDDPGTFRVTSRTVPFDAEDRIMSTRALKEVCAKLQDRFDLVHIQTPFLAHYAGLRFARRHGVPVVETYHTYFEQYLHHYLPLLPRSASRLIARTLSRRQCNAVDTVVAPTEQLAAVLRDYGVAAPIEVIPTGLDLKDFEGGSRERFRSELRIDLDRPVMLTVGRVAFEKNIFFIVDVLERVRVAVPSVLLVVAGEGPATGQLKRHVSARGLVDHVRFVGYLDRKNALLDCYRGADVFAFASRTETQGLVLLEAMALGLPVVSTAVLGTKAVLDGAGGAVIVNENAEQFAAAVANILRDRCERSWLSGQSSNYVACRWSSVEMARRMLVLYERLAHGEAPIDGIDGRPPRE